jgi:DNA primase
VYTDDVISRVRDSVDIVDLVSGYVSLKKRGKNWLGLCPFHSEKTPSFNVNPDKQIFHCFGCGVGGDAFKFLELQKGLSFPEAIRELAERAGITLPENRPRPENRGAQDERKTLLAVTSEAAAFFRGELAGPAGRAAREYLAKRGVSEAVIREFDLGWSLPAWDGLLRHLRQKSHAPELLEKAGLVVKRSEGEGHYDRFRGRIIFPIRDINGNVVAFGGRVMDDSLPKYLNSPETPLYSKSNILYGMDRAKDAARKSDHFIIVEGYLDAIACHQHGVRNAVATLGTALTEGHLRLMRRFTKKLKLIFDPDPAGVRAALRSFDLLVGSGMQVKVVSLPGGDDPDTVLAKRGREVFAASLTAAAPLMDFVLDQIVQDGAKASIDEKERMVSELGGYINKITSEIEKSHYFKMAAEALGVDEGDLRREITRHAGPVPARQPGESAPSAASRTGQRPRAEEMLVHLMLRDESIARSVAVKLAPGDFTDPLLRRAAERIFSVLSAGGQLDVRSLAVGGDDELNRLFSHFTVLDTEYMDPYKTSTDCIDRIRQQGSSERIKELLASIRQAESQGDHQRLQDLQRQLVEVRRGAPPERQAPVQRSFSGKEDDE